MRLTVRRISDMASWDNVLHGATHYLAIHGKGTEAPPIPGGGLGTARPDQFVNWSACFSLAVPRTTAAAPRKGRAKARKPTTRP